MGGLPVYMLETRSKMKKNYTFYTIHAFQIARYPFINSIQCKFT